MEMGKRPQSPIPGVQTFENMLTFLTDPGAVRERLAQLIDATREHQEAVAQIVEAEKIVRAVAAAEADRSAAHKELEEAQDVATQVVMKATAEAKQAIADALRETVELEDDLAARVKSVGAREDAVEAAEDAMQARGKAADGKIEQAHAIQTRAEQTQSEAETTLTAMRKAMPS